MPKKCRLKLFTNDRSFISLDRILNIFRVNVLVVSTESRLGKFWISFFLNPDSYIKGSRRELPARILHAILVKRERSTKASVTISYIKLLGMIDICSKGCWLEAEADGIYVNIFVECWLYISDRFAVKIIEKKIVENGLLKRDSSFITPGRQFFAVGSDTMSLKIDLWTIIVSVGRRAASMETGLV